MIQDWGIEEDQISELIQNTGDLLKAMDAYANCQGTRWWFSFRQCVHLQHACAYTWIVLYSRNTWSLHSNALMFYRRQPQSSTRKSKLPVFGYKNPFTWSILLVDALAILTFRRKRPGTLASILRQCFTSKEQSILLFLIKRGRVMRRRCCIVPYQAALKRSEAKPACLWRIPLSLYPAGEYNTAFCSGARNYRFYLFWPYLRHLIHRLIRRNILSCIHSRNAGSRVCRDAEI